MKLTLNIPDSSKIKAIPLIEYLKTLDFLTVDVDDDTIVPEWHIEKVRDRIKNSDSINLLDWENVKDNFHLD
jgi:hypothetical protein